MAISNEEILERVKKLEAENQLLKKRLELQSGYKPETLSEEREEALLKRLEHRTGRRDFLKALAGMGILGAVAKPAASTAITDKGIKDLESVRTENIYNRSSPADAVVWKGDNGVIHAEGKTKEIDSGTDFSTVMQSAVDYSMDEAYKEALGGLSRPAVVYLVSGIYTANSKIRIGSDPTDVSIPFVLKGDESTVIEYKTSPVIHSEPTIEPVSGENDIQQTYIYNIWFKSPDQQYENDCIHLIRWSGYLDRVHVRDAREALRIEMGWGKYCGVMHSTFSGGPGSGTGYGTVHIAPPDKDNTNNVTFLDCNFAAPGGGYCLLADDDNAHDNRLIDCDNQDYPGDGVKATSGQFDKIVGDLDYVEIAGSNFENCRLFEPVDISATAHKYGSRLTNCHVRKDVDNGSISISGMEVSNTKFEGQTIMTDCTVSNCRFTPFKDPQDFIVRFRGRVGAVSNILIEDESPGYGALDCGHAMEISDPSGSNTSTWKFSNIKIYCRETPVGIYRYTGGSSTGPNWIEGLYCEVNINESYSRANSYIIQNPGELTRITGCESIHNDKSQFTDDFSSLEIRNIFHGRSATTLLKSENKGTATITSGSTSVTVTHELVKTPSASDIQVAPASDMGSATYFYITNVGAASFDIVVDADPTVDVDFSWRAEVK